MSDVRRTYEDVLKDHGWLYYHGFSLPMTPEQLDLKLLISHLRAVEAELTATQEKLAAAEGASRLLRMRVLKLLEECDKRVGYKSENRYTIPWGEALLLREAVNAFDSGDLSTAPVRDDACEHDWITSDVSPQYDKCAKCRKHAYELKDNSNE